MDILDKIKYIFIAYFLCSSTCLSGGIDYMAYDYGPCYKEGGDHKEIKRLIDVLKTVDNDSDLIFVRSKCFQKINNLENSLIDIEKVIAASPTMPFAHIHRGELNLKRGKYKEAIHDFLYSIENGLNYDDYVANIMLSEAYNNLGEYQKSEKTLTVALNEAKLNAPPYEPSGDVETTNYSEVSIYIALADLYSKTNRQRDSIRILEEAMERNTGSIDIFNSLLDRYQSINDSDSYKKLANTGCKKKSLSGSKHCRN